MAGFTPLDQVRAYRKPNKTIREKVKSCMKVGSTSLFYLQAQQCGSRSLSMLSVIGCRRQLSMWLAACSVALAASVSLEQQRWWTTTWWRDTPPSPQRRATTSSMTKVISVVLDPCVSLVPLLIKTWFFLCPLKHTNPFFLFPAGEDRWLCTLLLKQGWRVEYNAASDAYTNAPEDFKELYNQVSAADNKTCCSL